MRSPKMVLVSRLPFIDGNHVEWTDRVRDALSIDDHDHFGMNGNEIRVRNCVAPAIGELKSKRPESIVKALPDLLNNHRFTLAWLDPGGNSIHLHHDGSLQSRRHARFERRRRRFSDAAPVDLP